MQAVKDFEALSTEGTGMSNQRPSPVRTAVGYLVGIVFLAASVYGFFLTAGDFGWVRGWAFIGLLTVCQSLSSIYLRAKNPEMLRHRGRAGPGTKTWDLVCLAGFALCFLGIPVVAALDTVRLGWSPVAPVWVGLIGAALYLLGLVLVTWAMAVNTHFEKTVRIQTDRNHRVIDSGPYAFVRHPGYTGIIFGWIAATPLILGSRWAFAPAAAAALCLVIRTALEDRTLRNELSGYEEYSTRVRYRLARGIW